MTEIWPCQVWKKVNTIFIILDTTINYQPICIYVHEESENCKLAKNCERKLCKFKHVNMKHECETVEASDDDDDDSSVEGVNLDQIKPVLEEFKKLWRTLRK